MGDEQYIYIMCFLSVDYMFQKRIDKMQLFFV